MNAPHADSHLGVFAKRPSRAKTIEKSFIGLFGAATYFIILCATILFGIIAVKGSMTVFQSSFPFVNFPFLAESPQTLYVFQWDPATFTDEQKAKIQAVEDEIRTQIPEQEAYFEEAIPKARQDEPETRAKLEMTEAELAEIVPLVAEMTKEQDRLNRDIEKAKDQVAAIRERVSVDPAEQPSVPESATGQPTPIDPELQEALELVETQEAALSTVNEELAAVQEKESQLSGERNALMAALPKNLEQQAKKELANLKASLEWPSQEFLEREKQQVATLTEEYEERIEATRTRFEERIADAETESDKGKLALRMQERIEDLETQRERRLAKARSYEVGDEDYRGIYAAKVEAAGLSIDTYSYSGGGIFPCIVGTVLLVVGSMTIALVLGVASAIYLSEYSKPGTLLNMIRLSILNLAGVPSIVFGLFGLGAFVLFLDWNVSLMAGWFTLAFMVLPVVITASEESLRSIPQGFREGSLALGATKWTSIRTNVLPYAMPGILTSSVLGIARVAGETAPIMFTAAYALRDNLPWQGLNSWTDFFFQGVMALPYHIYVVSTKIPQNEYTERMQYGTAFVFLVIVALIALASVLLRIRVRKLYKW